MRQNDAHEVGGLTAIDVFAGGGGLTVALKRAGFHVAAAVEMEPHSFATLKSNHPEIRAFKQDVRTVTGASLVAECPGGHVDLLVGCPPCQGFSSLTAKYRREDPRNALVSEMARLVAEIRPTALMFENVPRLSTTGRALFEAFVQSITDIGYLPEWKVLQAADFGVPQSRRRLVLVAGLGFPISLPKPSHSRDGAEGRKPWRTVREAIGATGEPITLAEAKSRGGPRQADWHVVRSMSPENKVRIRHVLPGKMRSRIPDELRPDCHKGKDEGFVNVYGRMLWDDVSPTITSGCTTLSKGRFGHPSEDRTISVREAALLQTFPPDYHLDTPYIDRACEIVGNAFPCEFAEPLAAQCAQAVRTARLA